MVNGLAGLPLTFIRPSAVRASTSEQASGQSIVQAVTPRVSFFSLSGIICKLSSGQNLVKNEVAHRARQIYYPRPGIGIVALIEGRAPGPGVSAVVIDRVMPGSEASALDCRASITAFYRRLPGLSIFYGRLLALNSKKIAWALSFQTHIQIQGGLGDSLSLTGSRRRRLPSDSSVRT